jgi:hypothetical protein
MTSNTLQDCEYIDKDKDNDNKINTPCLLYLNNNNNNTTISYPLSQATLRYDDPIYLISLLYHSLKHTQHFDFVLWRLMDSSRAAVVLSAVPLFFTATATATV